MKRRLDHGAPGLAFGAAFCEAVRDHDEDYVLPEGVACD